MKLTPNQRSALCEFARGADVNLTAQLARAAGKRAERQTARVILALLRGGMLQPAATGGLEISDAGREVAGKISAKVAES